MLELILYILFILGNIYFGLFDYINNFIIEHNQFFINLLAIIFYALLNEDFDLNIFEDNNEDDNDNLNEDLDKHIDNQEKKFKKK